MQEALPNRTAPQFAGLGTSTQSALACATSAAGVDFGQLRCSVLCPGTLRHTARGSLASNSRPCSQWVTTLLSTYPQPHFCEDFVKFKSDLLLFMSELFRSILYTGLQYKCFCIHLCSNSSSFPLSLSVVILSVFLAHPKPHSWLSLS